MSENLRFIAILELLIASDEVSNYTAAATLLETNRAGINDIRSGRKKLSIDLLRRLKQLYPTISLDYVIMGEGNPFQKEDNATTYSNLKEREAYIQKESSESLQELSHPGMATILVGMLREKDERILKQSEEIGRLKERLTMKTES